MAELKPCPFCGKNPTIEISDIEKTPNTNMRFRAYWTIKCPMCFIKKEDVSVYELQGFYETIKIVRDGRKLATEAWNRRAEDGK